ncbi:class F sortase [Nonomuraea sp. SYSU D8015]|uniref:class F sortase n=1 Tax=Nonomuraea sp. SYSU D8015 TaxID=2593644 RepID=UPI001660FF72|nr:class F sortase [Nonomuraea sp. SYSU D8015]
MTVRALLAIAAAGVLVAVGACAAEPAPREATPVSVQNENPTGAEGGNTRPVSDAQAGGAADARGADVARPVRLHIPAIGLSTRVIPLRLDAKGKLIAPESFDRVGWNKSGPEPGERGVAVIAGHVDSTTGPAVFYRLPKLRKGDRVHVDRADGTSVTFVVNRLARYPKDRIPDKEVYGSGGADAQLRLITCGGTFDRQRRSYRDNVIVFAS